MKETAVRPLGWQAWKDKHGRWAWLLWFEWASEWIVHWSQSWDFVKVLELVGKFTLLIAAVSWILEYGAREQARLDALKAKHYRAWELINSARGSTGDGGRREALQDLNKDGVSLSRLAWLRPRFACLASCFVAGFCRKTVTHFSGTCLAGVPLSKAFLQEVKLPSAEMFGADLREAQLSVADLRKATLSKADLRGAILIKAGLSRAFLSGADLRKADLSGADLSKTYLGGANLSEANLSGTILSGADLVGTNLSKAYLGGANLSGAFLNYTDLSGADLSGADLSGADYCNTTMPDGSIKNPKPDHC